MSVDLIKTNFDNSIFNSEFEKQKRELIKQKQKNEENRLKKLNQEIYKKKITDMSINELLIEWKNEMIGLLNDIINLRLSSLFSGNRLLFIGITIITTTLLFYLIMWIFKNKQIEQMKSVNEYHFVINK